MKSRISIRFIKLNLLVASAFSFFAMAESENLRSHGTNLCFGNRAYPTKADLEACEMDARTINKLSNDKSGLSTHASCHELMNNYKLRLKSGCFESAVVLVSSFEINAQTSKISNRKVSGTCEVQAPLGDDNSWKNGCAKNGHADAVEAEKCAVKEAIEECENKGFSGCDKAEPEVQHYYYFWGMHRCIARATILGQ